MANMNLIEPFLDDAMQPICDSFHVEMFVYFMFSNELALALCQKPNSFKFAIDTFSGWKCNQNQIGAANSTRFSAFHYSSKQEKELTLKMSLQ